MSQYGVKKTASGLINLECDEVRAKHGIHTNDDLYINGDSTSSRLDNLETELNDVYNKSEVDDLLDDYYTKIETDTLLDDYYNKNEIDVLLDDYYGKSEVDALLNLKSDIGHTHTTLSNVDFIESGNTISIDPSDANSYPLIKTDSLSPDLYFNIGSGSYYTQIFQSDGNIKAMSITGWHSNTDTNLIINSDMNTKDITMYGDTGKLYKRSEIDTFLAEKADTNHNHDGDYGSLADVTQNTSDILTNKNNISTNSSDILTNKSSIEYNQTQINTYATEISALESKTEQNSILISSYIPWESPPFTRTGITTTFYYCSTFAYNGCYEYRIPHDLVINQFSFAEDDLPPPAGVYSVKLYHSTDDGATIVTYTTDSITISTTSSRSILVTLASPISCAKNDIIKVAAMTDGTYGEGEEVAILLSGFYAL